MTAITNWLEAEDVRRFGWKVTWMEREMSRDSDDKQLREAMPIEAQCARNLAAIKAVFKPSMDELATTLGVPRRTVDHLQDECHAKPKLSAQLADLAQAADLIRAAGFSGHRYASRRALPGGGTLFERIRSGAPAVKVAEKLIAMLREERAQHDALQARLSPRTNGPVDMSEAGLPMLAEKI